MKPEDLGLPEKFQSFRNRQLETAAKINASRKYAYLLDAPTGIGKSLVAATVQRLMKKNIVYVCTTKQLQQQLVNDFPYARTVMGRSNYRCLKYPSMFPDITAEECNHTESNVCKFHNQCPYMVAKREARSAPIAVLNMAYFLSEVNFVGMFDGYDLLVVDECLPYKTRISLAGGKTEYIGKIVNQKKGTSVLSYNEGRGIIEPKPVVGWIRNPPPANAVTVTLDARGFPNIRCTDNHKLFSPSGWVEASTLSPGDLVYVKSNPRTGCSPPLPERAVDAILGSVLGDAGLAMNTSGSNRAYLAFTQKSKEYIDYKVSLLQPIFAAETCLGPNWYGEKTISKIGSTSTFALGELYDLCYPGDKKKTSREWLARVSELGLAIFYMDDGNLGHNNSVNFAVQDFSCESAQLICEWMKEKWDIDAVVRDEKGSVIHLVKGGNHKLFSMVAEYMHPSMEYKLPKEWRGKFIMPDIGQWLPLSEAVVLSVEASPFPKECSRSRGPGYSYDLKIDDNHNYFADGFLVHNCDTLEDQLMSHVEVQITQAQLKRLNIPPPKYKTKFESWVEWANPTLLEFSKELRHLEIATDKEGEWSTVDIQLLRRKRDVSRLVTKLRFFVREVDRNWIWYPGTDKWVFKPVWVAKYAQNAIWKHTKKVLGMSATILDPRQVSLNTGLNTDNKTHDYIQMPSPFPKENRPIMYEPCANVVNKQMDVALPALVKALKGVLDKHPDDKILVHTVSYKVRNFLLDKLGGPGGGGRIVTHSTQDRAIVLNAFKTSDKPLVLLSPSMDRGVDLPEEECRVVVICKMPYPDLGDTQVNRRVHASKDGNHWYAHKTVSSVVQMSGRAVRSESDYAVTYVLDRQFERLYNENKDMFPNWYKQAVIM